MRLFIAVFPPPAVQAGVDRAAAPLLDRQPGAWVRPRNLHFTLRFLGACDEAAIEPATRAMHAAVAGRPAFAVELRGCGAFPSPQRARVIWRGVGRGAAALEGLAAALESALVGEGFAPAAQPFAAHLTLGRPRQQGDWSARLGAASPDPITFPVERIALVSSELAAGGSRYVVLQHAALQPVASLERHEK